MKLEYYYTRARECQDDDLIVVVPVCSRQEQDHEMFLVPVRQAATVRVGVAHDVLADFFRFVY